MKAKDYIKQRKNADPEFAKAYHHGYDALKQLQQNRQHTDAARNPLQYLKLNNHSTNKENQPF